jgi:hypothetical protein
MKIYVTIAILLILCVAIAALSIWFYHKHYKFYRETYWSEGYVSKIVYKYIKNPNDHATPYKNPLFQTYHNKSKIPQEIYTNIEKYAPEYTHVVMDDDDLEKFIVYYFKDNVIETFRSLKTGAHKADLARYCLLYIFGGLYMDIKVELIKPLSQIFNKGDDVFYSVISNQSDHIHQAIIKTPSRNTLFLSLIDYIVITKNPYNYIDFCRDLYIQLKKDITIKEGMEIGVSGKKYYFLKEKCTSTDESLCYDGFDRYGLCCFIWDGDKPVIKSRRASFGKTW